MVFPSVYLAENAAYSGAITSHHDKQVFRNKSDIVIHLHNFNMREPLAIRADFILTLDDQTPLSRKTR